MATNKTYLGNPNLKAANTKINWTPETVKEYTKCMKDPLYFIEQYIRIISLDEGLIPFKMYKFQKKMIKSLYKNDN